MRYIKICAMIQLSYFAGRALNKWDKKELREMLNVDSEINLVEGVFL